MKPEALQSHEASRLLLVDGHAYAYRAFFAIKKLSSPDHKPTNAIYGFIKMLDGLIEAVDPERLAVVWDGGLSSERTTLLPGYKANRPSMPDDLSAQLDEIVNYLRASGIDSICHEGVEADDYIASMAAQAVKSGCFVVIASWDKDFMQLVSPSLCIYNPTDKTNPWLGPEEVLKRTGVQPQQIVDWLSLIGDAVDNIKGVPGVGPKTATGLLTEYGSIDGIYQHLGELPSARVKGALEAAKEAVCMNRKLITLPVDLRCDLPQARFSREKSDLQTLRSLYETWGFRKMLENLEKLRLRTPEFAF